MNEETRDLKYAVTPKRLVMLAVYVGILGFVAGGMFSMGVYSGKFFSLIQPAPPPPPSGTKPGSGDSGGSDRVGTNSPSMRWIEAMIMKGDDCFKQRDYFQANHYYRFSSHTISRLAERECLRNRDADYAELLLKKRPVVNAKQKIASLGEKIVKLKLLTNNQQLADRSIRRIPAQ